MHLTLMLHFPFSSVKDFVNPSEELAPEGTQDNLNPSELPVMLYSLVTLKRISLYLLPCDFKTCSAVTMNIAA